jgi:hydrogenase maturation factor
MSVEKDEHGQSGDQSIELSADVSAPGDFLIAQDAKFLPGTSRYELLPMQGASCELDAEGHCITCSDEALPAKILRIDEATGLALVEVEDTTEEIDITLVDDLAPGDMVLVHGGVAIGHVES